MKSKKFIENAIKVHGEQYDYSLVKYKTYEKHVEIICKQHGIFKQSPRCHLSGNGCQKCGRERTVDSKKITTEDFIKRSIVHHGDLYDYSLVEFTKITDKIIIICKIHDKFEQHVKSHMAGRGCRECARQIIISKNKNGKASFVEKAKKVHGEQYKYSLLPDDLSLSDKITIICKDHGEFTQIANGHLQGNGCPKCAKDSRILSNSLSFEQFLLRAKNIHGDKYCYKNVNYINGREKIQIGCPVHGAFLQTPNSHIYHAIGCPNCTYLKNISNGQQQIADIIENEEVIINDRKAIYPLELDIYLPKRHLAIEYHGLYYHSFNRLENKSERERHQNKALLAASKGIKLLQFYENEWKYDRHIIQSMISHNLGRSNKIFARKCAALKISNKEAIEFLNINHLLHGRNAKYSYGLVNEGTLVGVMTFTKHHKYEYELMRCAFLYNTTVIGGFSKLLKYAIRDLAPSSIFTYVDNRISDAQNHIKHGFKYLGLTKPGYFYTKGSKLYSRHRFQKAKLVHILEDYSESLSESQNMFNNGYRRIWDAGHHKLLLLLSR